MELPPDYLRGIELFNEGRYYECHEAWETVWLEASGTEREFLHAMIQVAAALLHRERGNEKGAASVYQRARRKLASLPKVVMQLRIESVLRDLEAAFSATHISPPQIRVNG
jgi:hypothetical protein